MRKCVNKACEWHEKGTCRLFPKEFYWLTCKHYEERTERTNETKPQKRK